MHEDFIIHTDVSMIRYTFGMWKKTQNNNNWISY